MEVNKMFKTTISLFILMLTLTALSFGQAVNPPDSPVPTSRPKTDEFNYGKNKLTISFLGHATLMFYFNGTIIHVDPVGQYADYATLPKADLILITHAHPDHLDKSAITQIEKKGTMILLNQESFNNLKKGTMLANGQKWEGQGITVEAVPAYNTTKGHLQYHPKGRDNGYVVTLGSKRIYLAGDTEDIPEMAALKDIDIAFLPMNQPYTMLPEQVARAAKMFKPAILYPYHYGKTDPEKLVPLLADTPQIELRIRDLR